MNPVIVAARGKGAAGLLRRVRTIGSRYGVRPGRMERRIGAVLELARRHGFRPTLPVTAAAAERHPRVIERFAELGVEFAVHGLYHVDHAGLTAVEQVEQLGRARDILRSIGLPATGFRAPYLRTNDATMHALSEHGFVYDSSQAVSWPVDPGLETNGYRRALDFYSAVPALDRPSLPRVEAGLVRIPCSIPDDEAAIDRLGLSPEAIAKLWVGMQQEVYGRGEMLTLAIHPERVEPCTPGIEAVLDAARPGVWAAPLEDVARWWLDRASSVVSVAEGGDGYLRIRVDGPPGVSILARSVQVPGGEAWGDGFVRAPSTELEVRADRRPFVGVSPGSPEALSSFLREQGFIVEPAASGGTHACFLDLERFTEADERALLDHIEADRSPLVRLGRWPNGARSALALTGDVDALTIWDYGLRFMGR